ncbi:NAD(+) diphosphatase [Halotalea alkalilenta]|uniref:NAD(+) diphosphatase n=1 Tax=Halotalea alkalilenta TaxID=376489 RepID=UPI0009EF000C|nr:NAD(+) diphosphatase [Halotalea alkalilenta]
MAERLPSLPVLERGLIGSKRIERARTISIDQRGRIAPGELDGILGPRAKPAQGTMPIGRWRGEPVMVRMFDEERPEWPGGREWLGQLPEFIYPLLSTALQVATWRRDHRFCGRCGTATRPHGHEFAMVCPRCGFRGYPRISPCIITLVTFGRELLLARSPRFAPGRFSTLAGFIEAGESAEEALRREVMEEVGVEVGRISYFKSQSWPFPHSFMLGYYAEAASREIHIDGIEIEAADWFMPEMLPALPPSGSISRALIDHFVNGVAARD